MKQLDRNDIAAIRAAEFRAERPSAPFDLGHEPPLDLAGQDQEEVSRRGVNLRWLGASVLTGLAGAALIGAAIYVSFDGETTFAQSPERVVPTAPRPQGTDERGAPPARKGDKLVRAEMIASAKQQLRTPVTIRVGDREVIKPRSFVRLATNLSLTSGVHATDIPPFNPLRLFAEDNGERVPEPQAPPAEVGDADVSVMKRDLVGLVVDPASPGLTDDDVLAQVEEDRRLNAEAGRRPQIPVPAQLMLSRTLRQPGGLADPFSLQATPDTAFSTIEVRVVPENVTALPKVEPRAGEALVEDRDVVLKRGETMETVLRANGAHPELVRTIFAALSARARTGLVEGQRMRLLVAPGPRPRDGRQIVRVILFGENGIEEIVAANDRGVFVSVSPPVEERVQRPATAQQPETEGEDEEEGSGVRLYESLYETALKNDLPRQTVEELIRVFGYDVDFQRRVQPGDNLELFWAQDEEGAQERPEILYAALTIGGEPRRVYRFQSPEDGTVDFFDEQGRSLKKFLIRKPIAEGVLRSGFGYRRHPVLGYSKMHTGVDWSNRIGTPIIAAGNGTVIKAEWDSGYGRRIELQHANGYVTAYSHQSRFAPGIKPGARVRQGQVIGYVGSTGLSTGPHLHYEVIVNGHFVDPLKIRVPRGRELDGRALAEFRRQKDALDGLLVKAGSTRLAQRDVRAP